ncbi:hypothetical protein OE88DRAFT_1505124 [Heliocybe sulcata]|uniref:Uncharacterized protein n=1 Tax=Heliocybe sulcata TaxID=5364 RepID=A0A5C3N6F3_9AGAM|nr:hypothetical protein OE88DRAFT_1505124 [Heliocybe sulcata]
MWLASASAICCPCRATGRTFTNFVAPSTPSWPSRGRQLPLKNRLGELRSARAPIGKPEHFHRHIRLFCFHQIADEDRYLQKEYRCTDEEAIRIRLRKKVHAFNKHTWETSLLGCGREKISVLPVFFDKMSAEDRYDPEPDLATRASKSGYLVWKVTALEEAHVNMR